MSAHRPGRGPIATTGEAALSQSTHASRNAQRRRSGAWRADKPFTHVNGLKITMRRAHGVTDLDVLTVPMRFQAPVVGDFARQFGFNWSTYDTLRAGQRSRPMGNQLLELPLSTMLLDRVAQDDSSGVVVWPHAPEPLGIIDELKYIAGMVAGGKATPFRLTVNQPAVWGDAPIINMLAVLTRVAPTQKAGEVGTEYLDLTFLEFREDEISRRRQPRADEKTRYYRIEFAADPQTGVLHTKESLYDLAKRYYHQPSAWRRIAFANGIKGVDPWSSGQLATWAVRHRRRRLRIPPAPRKK